VEYLYQELERYQDKIFQFEKDFICLEKDFQRYQKENNEEMERLREGLGERLRRVEKDSKAGDEMIRLQCAKIQQEMQSFQSYVDASFLPLTEQLKVSSDPSLPSPIPLS
jgi:predicted  nucleic acid-binding Zn-ribbon protein